MTSRNGKRFFSELGLHLILHSLHAFFSITRFKTVTQEQEVKKGGQSYTTYPTLARNSKPGTDTPGALAWCGMKHGRNQNGGVQVETRRTYETSISQARVRVRRAIPDARTIKPCVPYRDARRQPRKCDAESTPGIVGRVPTLLSLSGSRRFPEDRIQSTQFTCLCHASGIGYSC